MNIFSKGIAISYINLQGVKCIMYAISSMFYLNFFCFCFVCFSFGVVVVSIVVHVVIVIVVVVVWFFIFSVL